MGYTNSRLAGYVKLSPNHSGQRTHVIDRITPHCTEGQVSAETLGGIFAQTARKASSNYGIGADGRVGMYVEEKNRSWCSSSAANDQRAVTIECASDKNAPHAFRDAVYRSLVELCADICKRNGKKKLLWLGDREKTLAYEPKGDEMVLTVHRWFANKSCPGDWMYARMGNLAEEVTARLAGADVWRLYNPNSGEHFLTARAEERDALTSAGWNDEGVAFKAADKADEGAGSVYRLYDGTAHLFTADQNEVAALESAGWKNEGTAFYALREGGNGRTGVLRLYNPESGLHHWTADEREGAALEDLGWALEGMGWTVPEA